MFGSNSFWPKVFGLGLFLDQFFFLIFLRLFSVICNLLWSLLGAIQRGYSELNAEYCGNSEVNMEALLCYLPIQYAVCWVAKHTLISDNGMQYAVLL